MQEDGHHAGDTYELPKPFFVLATDRPIIEKAGYPSSWSVKDQTFSFLIKSAITPPQPR